MPDPDREARRAAALRANLRRRKAISAPDSDAQRQGIQVPQCAIKPLSE